MKYTVTAADQDNDFVTLEADDGTVYLTTEGTNVALSYEEFKELRKAVGYVWTEVEQDA